MIVVDTNVASELMRDAPTPAVDAWLHGADQHDVRITAVSIAELRYGIRRLPVGGRRDRLQAAADDVLLAWSEDVLPFDRPAAEGYADLVNARELQGAPISIFDGQIAAICLVHGATLVTRNVKDFQDLGIDLVDPWNAG